MQNSHPQNFHFFLFSSRMFAPTFGARKKPDKKCSRMENLLPLVPSYRLTFQTSGKFSPTCALTHKRIVCTQGDHPLLKLRERAYLCVCTCARARESRFHLILLSLEIWPKVERSSISETRKFAFPASSFRGVAAMQMTS
jgi:hypothetical protein